MDQTTQDVHKVKMTKPKKPEHKNPKQTDQDNPNQYYDDKMPMSSKPCNFCGRKHCRGRANCAAWGCVCGHVASQCKAKEKAHNVEFAEGETSEEEFVYCVTSKPEITSTVNSVSEREIYIQMLVNEQPIKFRIDCGATVNVLPIK